MSERHQRPCVLVFAGHDPSGGAGIQADIEAIAAQGAHAVPIITALTVQDNNRVHAIYPVSTEILREQFDAVFAQLPIAAIKLGIVGSFDNANLIADCIARLRQRQPEIFVVVDPVLASGHGDALAIQDPLHALRPLLAYATLLTPNLPELARLIRVEDSDSNEDQKAEILCRQFSCDVLLKGGHAQGELVSNHWFQRQSAPTLSIQKTSWHWPRLHGEFHGSGCTLAAAIAGRFALGDNAPRALSLAQDYVQQCLRNAYAIASGQAIPSRSLFQGAV
ncbi:hydroxymethylpyrimidine/phosphomethylpyrimidine kinase [Undibacterium sp.]|uniref:bifunctional hydroxymethylpyrimidine kinase/phosphomethylpyrimidine kinase n=1 Tax=Undibacterium sp. TaxID=1914977 RepID=UPI003752C62A